MTLLWLPDAVRDPHPRSFPWSDTTAPKGCLHTTEGTSWPDYEGWTIMPHATVLPTPGKGVTVRQHLPFSQASFALRHLDPQPTNGDFVFQFELIGTCDPAGPGYYWPHADDAVLVDLYRKVILPLSNAYEIPLHTPPFKAYAGSYGTANGVRLTDAQFDAYTGWLGHEHVPQNLHGDPGWFPWGRLITLSNGDDMPTLDDIGALLDKKLAAARDSIVSELLGTELGRTGPTVGVALQSGYVAATHAASTADAILTKLGPAPAGEVA